MKIRQWTRAAAVAAAAGLALTACSGGGGSSSGATEDDAPQTLRLSQAAPPANFQIGNWAGGDATLFLSVYDTIVHRGVDGELEPAIAESWEYNEDRTQLTLDIRDGMEFTNGEPVDAEAVVASLEAARAGSSTAQNLASVQQVEATDESTVVVTLAQPDGALVDSLSSTVGAVGAPDVLTAEESKLSPIGSGPYTLSAESTVGSKYILEKNEDHWNADAYPYETVEVQVIADPSASQNAVLSGQLDFAGLQSADALTQFPEDRFSSGVGKANAVAVLWLVDREGKVVPALSDVRVRQAINLAFDRAGIEKNLNPGTNHATNQIFSPEGEAFSEDLLEETPHDVDRAKELLAEAGYPDGFPVTMPSVTGITTTYESVITQSLADIGVQVTWESVPFQDFYAKVFGGNYGMFFMFNGFGGSPALDFKTSTSGIFNPSGATTPELQELVTSAYSASEEEQGEAYAAINEYLVAEAWYAPITYVTGFWVAPTTIDYTPPVAFGQSVEPFQPAGSE